MTQVFPTWAKFNSVTVRLGHSRISQFLGKACFDSGSALVQPRTVWEVAGLAQMLTQMGMQTP